MRRLTQHRVCGRIPVVHRRHLRQFFRRLWLDAAPLNLGLELSNKVGRQLAPKLRKIRLLVLLSLPDEASPAKP